MKEIRINLRGSWRRVLAMITVAAMCFSVVSVTPAFATTDENKSDNPLKGVSFTAVTADEGTESAVEIKLPEGTEKVVTGEEVALTGAATIVVADESAIESFTTEGYSVSWSAAKKADDSTKEGEDQEGSSESLISEDGVFKADEVGNYTVTLNVTEPSSDEEEAREANVLTGTMDINVVENEVEDPDNPGGENPGEPEDPVSPGEVVTTVEAVKISKAATELTVGGTEKLTAEVKVSPTDAEKPAPEWNSSNEKVATVAADGTVKAIAAGTADITATAKIGDSEKTSAPCAVTVKAETVPSTDKPTEGNKPQNAKSNSAPKVGEKKVISGVTYKVAKANAVTYQKPKKNAKKVTIPATVKINGKTYKVTAVEKNAFKGNKKVKTVKVGKNVTTIGASAFQNCKALTTVTLPAKTTTIGKNAFANSKKLKKIVIKSTKMTKKTVKNGAFKKVSKKATVDVPNKKAKTYKKLFQKKGLPKACEVK